MNHQVAPETIWTIGHSTHSFEIFLALLVQHGVRGIADVRRFPGSRRYPHFGEVALRNALASHGIAYIWLPELGGRRAAKVDSPNGGWRNAAFRGYADHLDSAEFATGMQKLRSFASQQPSALMCAESLWWQCHRSLIADVLKMRGVEVLHILGDAVTAHPFTAPARIVEGQLCYPPTEPKLVAQGDLFS